MSVFAGWGSFFLLALMWGCSFLAIHFAVQSIPPFAAAFLRIFIASVILAGLGLFRRIPFPTSRRLVFQLALVGIINFAVPWACLFWGEQFVHPALASILNATVPIFVLLWSWGFLPDEQPTKLKVLGVGLGFFGMTAIFAPAMRGAGLAATDLHGMGAILLMSVAYALGAVFVKKLVAKTDATWGISIQGFAASAALFLFVIPTEGTEWITDWSGKTKAVLGVLYLAIFSTALAWLIFYRLIREWGAVRSSTVAYVAPFVAIAVDWIYFRQLPTWPEWIGVGLILSGIYLIHRARIQELRTQEATVPTQIEEEPLKRVASGR